jgi:hypothetical protein
MHSRSQLKGRFINIGFKALLFDSFLSDGKELTFFCFCNFGGFLLPGTARKLGELLLFVLFTF